MPDISAVICVYTEKRWDDIVAAVQSVHRQTLPPVETILVVDHNQLLFSSLTAEFPSVRVVENQETQGLSGGRNTGASLAKGDIVAFLDDDAIAEPDWLLHIAECYDDPKVCGVGGLTLPAWDTKRPFWFPREFDWVLGCTYIGMPESREPVRNILGGNASFRRDVFDIAGGFSNKIGRSVSRLPLGCEETEFCIRLRQLSPSSVLLFDNQAVIWHRVSAARCHFSYFSKRCYAEGLSKALVTASVGSADGLSSERRYVSKTLPRGVNRGVMDALSGRPAGLARSAAIIAGLVVTLVGYTTGIVLRRIRPVAISQSSAISPRINGRR